MSDELPPVDYSKMSREELDEIDRKNLEYLKDVESLAVQLDITVSEAIDVMYFRVRKGHTAELELELLKGFRSGKYPSILRGINLLLTPAVGE